MTTEQAKQVLKEAGYFVNNLWTVEDVQSKFDVDDEKAQEILNATFLNNRTIMEIWEVMEIQGEEMGLERIDL